MANAAVEVRPALSAGHLESFIDAAYAVRGKDRRWVPQLNVELRAALAKGSPIVAENEVEGFVAYRGAIAVGRILAIVNKAYLARHRDQTGHFGFLEAVDDPAVFSALFDAAMGWLSARRMTRILGPFNATINHEAGLMVQGFEAAPMVHVDSSPPYYARIIESLGFEKTMDLVAASCRIAESDFPERARRILARSAAAGEISTRGLSYFGWNAAMEKVVALYNDAWSENWGAVPLSPAEARMIGKLMLTVVKPYWIRIAEFRGEAIAIVAQIPNASEVTAALGGRLLPLGWARLLWGIHARGTKTTRVPMIGVARRWRGTKTGAAAIGLLLAEAVERARAAAVEEMEISWMLETNRAVLNLAESLPARRTKLFRIYQRRL